MDLKIQVLQVSIAILKVFYLITWMIILPYFRTLSVMSVMYCAVSSMIITIITPQSLTKT